MKKIIVAISVLLIAALALSVAALGAPSNYAAYGVNTYYLGDPVKSSTNKIDGSFGTSEYVVSYKLPSAVYVDRNDKVLDAPADQSAVTSGIKVGLSYDVDFIYVAIQASLASVVSDVDYILKINDKEYTVSTTKTVVDEEGFKCKTLMNGTVFTGEFAIPNDSIGENYVVNDTYTLKITEVTKNNKGDVLNKSIWNVIKLTNKQKLDFILEETTPDYLVQSFVLGVRPSDMPVVSVTTEPVSVIVTTTPVTTEAPTTEAVTTETPTTEAVTTEAPTTEVVTTEAPTTDLVTTEAPTTEVVTTETPATEEVTTEEVTTDAVTTEAPTTEITVIGTEKGCKNSIGMMGIALVAALGTCAVVATKKKED